MPSTRHSILGSSVFQRVLLAAGLFVAISLAALWALTGLTVTMIENAQEESISEMLSYGEDLYYGQSEAALIDEIASEDGPIWSDDEIYWINEEGAQIVVFRNADSETLAGYPELWAGDELERMPVSHPDLEGEIRARSVELRGGSSLTVGEFIPETHYDAIILATFGSYALILIVLPLALITGFILSRGVFNRIEGISETAAAISRGEMTRRAPVTGRLDEFDRLAIGINHMLDRVDALNSNIEAVSVGVAHDLKTPLANIGGRLELIRRDMQDGSAVAEHVETAEGYLAQVLRIFDAILRLGEIEAGGRRAAFQTVNISQLANNMYEGYLPVFEDAQKRLTSELDDGIDIQGDPELLQQLIANLLENALEHSRDAAKVDITLETSEDGVVFAIEDDGPGIAPPDRNRIFDRFYRADRSRSSPGNGLGLSIVKAISDLHGAEVTVVSNTKGARFSVLFQKSG